MPKNAFQDIVVRPKRPAPAKTGQAPAKIQPQPKTMLEGKKTAKKKTEEISKIFKKTNYPVFTASSNEDGGRFAIWALAVVSIIFLVFALSSLFSGAVVTVTPKSEVFTLKDDNFKAELNNPDADLSYQLMTLSDVETKTINSSQPETLDTKASGRVVVYNNFSKQSQQLVINTRLEDPTGLIFRIENSVTVPGTSIEDGITIPGSVEVTVHADKAGSQYNVGLTDFTIPGFKGSSKYEKFYARSKTEIGGAVTGLMYVAPQDEVEKIRSESAISLNDKLFKKAKAELPKGYTLIKGATFFEVTNNDATFTSKDSTVPVFTEGKLLAIIIDENKLSSQVAKLVVNDINNDQKIIISDVSGLNFALKNDQATLISAEEINFSLAGNGTIVWQVDEAKLADDLKGKSKSELSKILFNYPEINRAEAKVSPFWRSKFPKDDGDIKIINTLVFK